MEKILYFDVCAIVIMAILFSSVFLHKMTKGTGNRAFIAAAICCLLAAVFDILCEMYGIWLPISQGNLWFRTAAMYGYFTFRNLTALVYVMYLVSLVDNWHRVRSSRMRQFALFAPYTAVLISLVLNPWTHSVFYFDAAMQYHRGGAIVVLYISSGLYLLYSLYYITKHRKLFSRDKQIALYSLFFLTVAAVAVQYFLPGMLVEVFATAVAMLFVIITVQRPEENVHRVIGTPNYQAYVFSAKRAFYNKKQIDVILVKLTNHAPVLSILGYEVQNHLLKKLVVRLRQCGKDLCVDGAELYYLEQGMFAVILGGRDRKKTWELAESIHRMFHTPMVFDRYTLALNAQICVACCPKDLENFEKLSVFEHIFFNSSPGNGAVIRASDIVKDSQFQIKTEINSIISRALTNRSFEVYYQPIYSIEQQRFASAEALVRLRDETYGMVSPALFIPEAEKNGTIHQIGEFVFEEVCRFIKSPEFEALALDYIEINLSVAQCMQANLAQKLSAIVERHQIDPRRINLEITETAVESTKDVMTENLAALRKMGFHFSLDDYGTGYSNIQRIATLPLNIVKVDKCFTDKYTDEDTQIILANTIRMLKGLRLEVVIEGVETAEQLDFFKGLDCEHIQGYYFSKPLPREEFMQFIRENLPVPAGTQS